MQREFNSQKIENKNNKEENDSNLAKRKAQLIAARRRYYVAENRDSEFNTLPGHIQRAIEREANFQVDSMIKSDTFAPHLDSDNTKELFDAHCEYYAHIGIQEDKANPFNPQNLFKKLVTRDSDANKGYVGIEGNDNRKTERHAATIDQKASNIKKTAGDFNPQTRISALMLKQDIRA